MKYYKRLQKSPHKQGKPFHTNCFTMLRCATTLRTTYDGKVFPRPLSKDRKKAFFFLVKQIQEMEQKRDERMLHNRKKANEHHSSRLDVGYQVMILQANQKTHKNFDISKKHVKTARFLVEIISKSTIANVGIFTA